MTKETKILIIGACGQIGTELTEALSDKYGKENIIAADLSLKPKGFYNYIQLDALDHERMEQVVTTYSITQIYLLAAMLSANGEKNIDAAWKLNVESLLSVLKIAVTYKLDKIFWPSSIAVFGPGAPKHNCPQNTIIEPTTVYGMSKRAGENWCKYYFDKYDVDVRSIRYPGLVSYTAPPGGGTTDYAVDIFHHALQHHSYTCFLQDDTCLPMMYMTDAIRATLELMEAPREKIKIRTSYNIAGMSFSPCDIANAIRFHIPEFTISYSQDRRQVIANSWPASINDSAALDDWGWSPNYNLKSMVKEMLINLSENTKNT